MIVAVFTSACSGLLVVFTLHQSGIQRDHLMPLRMMTKPNRAGPRRLIGMIYLETFGLFVLVLFLKSDLTPELSLEQVQWIVAIYAVAGVGLFLFLAIRWRASVYFGSVMWSRRFSQTTLIVFVVPLFMVLSLASIPIVRHFFPLELEAFWDRGEVRGLLTVAAAFGFAVYLLVLLSCCLLAWMRGIRCGDRNGEFTKTTAIPVMFIAVAVFGVATIRLVTHYTPSRAWPLDDHVGQFRSEKCRQLLIAGC